MNTEQLKEMLFKKLKNLKFYDNSVKDAFMHGESCHVCGFDMIKLKEEIVNWIIQIEELRKEEALK